MEPPLPISITKSVSSPRAQPTTVEEYLPQLANAWELPIDQLQARYDDLCGASAFLADLNQAIQDVPEFAGVRFAHVSELRLYRCLLYLFTRVFRPQVFVETGVLNGFSSAFVLLAMEHNGTGTLFSIDLPPVDERILAQGTGPLPQDKKPGWVIPQALRLRHQLSLGDARILLLQILESNVRIDAFLHDSDHSYQHMMFEISLAWPYLSAGGWLLCDNVEQNSAFSDFVRGVGASSFVAASFDTPDRVWKHGMARKSGSDLDP